MEKIGYIIETHYDNPDRWERDDNFLYPSLEFAESEYNKANICSECGFMPLDRDIKKGYIRMIPVFKGGPDD